jgi:hypothetical protein
MVMPTCAGDGHAVDELELEIPRCSSGPLELFVAVTLGRVVSRVWSVAVELGAD